MSVLFISDLHLDAVRPEATRAFIDFLRSRLSGVSRLYILGDLFEAWVRDDDPDPLIAEILGELSQAASNRTTIYFMRGNRDFLMGDDVLRSHGLTPLPDPTLISVLGESVLLSHGDIYCTDDKAYQRFRRITRHPLVQRIYHRLPLAMRTAIVTGARRKSTSSIAQKPAAIMDVNPTAIDAALRAFGVDTLLHGHTHRPAIHEWELDGHTAKRIVLGDWYEAGSALLWDENGPRLIDLAFD